MTYTGLKKILLGEEKGIKINEQMNSLSSYKDAWAIAVGQSSVQLSVNTFSKQLYHFYMGFPGGWAVKNLPAMPETAYNERGMDLISGLEDPLGEGVKTHSNIFAWEISWTEEPGRLLFMGS